MHRLFAAVFVSAFALTCAPALAQATQGKPAEKAEEKKAEDKKAEKPAEAKKEDAAKGEAGPAEAKKDAKKPKKGGC